MATVELRDLAKSFGAAAAVDRVSLNVPSGAFVTLLGPSGCGKTTTLRAIAGLVEPDSGTILLGGEDVTRAPIHRRDIGMVFQSHALFPHMTVAANVGFGLRMRGVAAADRDARVREALALVRLEAFGDRFPAQLSGGQQQRVALARALVIRPRCLLLDEPLSNLDARLRLEMRGEIRRVCKEFGLTAIYVTHDQKEALSIADRMAILEAGRIRQTGTPAEVYRHPHSRFVADFMGETNFLDGKIRAVNGTSVVVETGLREFGATLGGDGWQPRAGESCTLSIRPESWRLATQSGAQNEVAGRLTERVYLGEMAQYRFAAGPHALKVFELNPRFVELSPERELFASVEPSDVVALPA